MNIFIASIDIFRKTLTQKSLLNINKMNLKSFKICNFLPISFVIILLLALSLTQVSLHEESINYKSLIRLYDNKLSKNQKMYIEELIKKRLINPLLNHHFAASVSRYECFAFLLSTILKLFIFIDFKVRQAVIF